MRAQPEDEGDAGIVWLLDHRALSRYGLVALLEDWAAEHGLVVCSSASKDWRPDAACRLAVVNLGSGELDGPEADELLPALASDVPVVVVADSADADWIRRGLTRGIRGFIPTTTEPNVACHIFSLVLAGGTYLPASLIAGLLDPPRGVAPLAAEEPGGNWSLSPKQREVLRCLRGGKSNKQIARELAMRESTVKVHVRQILRKLGASNRTQAALLAADLPADADHPDDGELRTPA